MLATLARVTGQPDADSRRPVCGADLVVVSPWLADVDLAPIGNSPWAGEIPTAHLPDDPTFSEVIRRIVGARGRVLVATLRERQPGESRFVLAKSLDHVRREAALLDALRAAGCQLLALPRLHAKVVLTASAAVVGSSNLTHAGHLVNRELNALLTRYAEPGPLASLEALIAEVVRPLPEGHSSS